MGRILVVFLIKIYNKKKYYICELMIIININQVYKLRKRFYNRSFTLSKYPVYK